VDLSAICIYITLETTQKNAPFLPPYISSAIEKRCIHTHTCGGAMVTLCVHVMDRLPLTNQGRVALIGQELASRGPKSMLAHLEVGAVSTRADILT
jgi:hypothetical protein